MSWRNNSSLQTERERPVGIGVLKPGVRPTTPGSDVFKDPKRVKAQEQEYDRQVTDWTKLVAPPKVAAKVPTNWSTLTAPPTPKAAERPAPIMDSLTNDPHRLELLKTVPTERFARMSAGVNPERMDELLGLRAAAGIDDSKLKDLPGFQPAKIEMEKQGSEHEFRGERNARLWREANAKAEKDLAGKPEGAEPGEVRELSEQEFFALTPRQRAAVLYNTELVQAAAADKKEGGDSNTREFLTDLDLLNDKTDIDSFLGLDRAIGDSILAKLDDKDMLRQSADAARWARGHAAAAPTSTDFLEDRSAAAVAAGRMADSLLTKGALDVRGGAKLKQVEGLGTGQKSDLLRSMFTTLASKEVEGVTGPDDIVEGLQAVNAQHGTDITPEELWDFAARELEAVSYGRVRGVKAKVRLFGEGFTPASAKEVRKRFGL